jgi:putative acetyltransferase
MAIAIENPDQPEVVKLIEELDAYQSLLYPPESNHGIDLATLSQPSVLFAVARSANGEVVGCCAVAINTSYGEIKRLFVRPHHRGHGIAKMLLTFLETEAMIKGCTLLMLETGVSQPEALSLYERVGYVRCDPFGSYTDDPLSVFMQKRLTS